MKIKPSDLIALLVLLGCFLLMWHGKDGTVSSVMSAVVGFYFGHRGILHVVGESGKRNRLELVSEEVRWRS